MKRQILCLHLKQLPNLCVFNNYFRSGLLNWEANLDIQPNFNHCKVITYICACLSKTEDECSGVMYQAFQEAMPSNFTNYDKMKLISRANSMKRTCRVKRQCQNCCYEKHFKLWFLLMQNS